MSEKILSNTIKKTRVKFNPELSANRLSNNWALERGLHTPSTMFMQILTNSRHLEISTTWNLELRSGQVDELATCMTPRGSILNFYEFTPCTTRFARWHGFFIIFMLACVCHRHVIVLGDINTAHKMIDHCDPDEEVKK